MDPFFTASTPATHSRRRSRHIFHDGCDAAQPTASESLLSLDDSRQTERSPEATSLSSKSPGIRRSAGIFNLKIHSPSKSSVDASEESCLMNTSLKLPLSKPRSDSASLKRPHPFSTTKPLSRQWGFLSRSTLSSPKSTKRLHRPDQLSDRLEPPSIDTEFNFSSEVAMPSLPSSQSSSQPPGLGSSAPSSSAQSSSSLRPRTSSIGERRDFQEAKPVQTAFDSAGLRSKQHAPQTPAPQVPKTPVKRAVSANDLDLDDGSPFPGLRAPYVSSNRDSNGMEVPDSRLKLNVNTKSRMKTPIDKLKRFSIGPLDETELPSTPTRHPQLSHPYRQGNTSNISILQRPNTHPHLANLSNQSFASPDSEAPHFSAYPSSVYAPSDTPQHSLSDLHLAAGRQLSQVTVTPGTAIKPRPRTLKETQPIEDPILRSADPSDSLSMSPLWSRDSTSFGDSTAGPQTPGKLGDDSIPSPNFVNLSNVSDRASPRRPRLRMFNFRSDKPEVTNTPISAKKCHNTTMDVDELSMELESGPTNSSVNLEDFDSGSIFSGMLPPDCTPLVPPLRLETPLNQARASGSPKTPSTSFLDSPPLHGTASIGDMSKMDEPGLYDPHLAVKFDKVQSTAHGEFSTVYVVIKGRQKFAVKRTKCALAGQRSRSRQREEIDILRTLTQASTPESPVIRMVDEWEYKNFGYIMTEYCENGDLNAFLAAQGRVSRLEEWRVWKIMVEVLHGLAIIHSHDIMHLDLKPANVFVTFEGHLKIGDFGMATRCPTPEGFEREGDREYIAPEVLERHQYGKPADIFSIGLMMVEVAANIVLPDNGVHWHRLRSGDLSDAGRLSSGDLASARINQSDSGSVQDMKRYPSSTTSQHNSTLGSFTLGHCDVKEGEIPNWAPKFLVDNSCLLDRIVSMMLCPQPERRPTVAQLLTIPELMLVYQRGQAGAIVYEGEFGPKPEIEDESGVWQRT